MEIFNKNISSKNVIFFIITILTLVFITKIKDIAVMFFASYVIACSLNPLVDKIMHKYNIKRGLASGIIFSTTLLAIIMILVPIIAIVGYQIKAFIIQFPIYFTNAYDFLSHNPLIHNSIINKAIIAPLISFSMNIPTEIFNNSIILSKNLASWFTYLIAASLIIYYFMADKPTVEKAYLSLFPRQMKKKAHLILKDISTKIGGYISALLVTIICVGVVMTTGLLLLGVDYAVLLGLITAILDIIPIIGPAIALLICLVACFKSGWITLVLIVVVFSAAQIIENNFVRPLVFGKLLDIHPLIIYFFLFLTAQYLGVIGVIFAPAIAATVCVLIEELYIKNIN